MLSYRPVAVSAVVLTGLTFTWAQPVIGAPDEAAASAQVSANSAQTSANSALVSANSAQTSANSALVSANSAQTSANSALVSANSAQTSANSALVSGNSAQTSANSAQVSANSAQASAQSTAETAKQAAADLKALRAETGRQQSASEAMNRKLETSLRIRLNQLHEENNSLKEKLEASNTELTDGQSQVEQLKAKLAHLESFNFPLEVADLATDGPPPAYLLLKMPADPKSFVRVGGVEVFSNGRGYQLVRIPVSSLRRSLIVSTDSFSKRVIILSGSVTKFDGETGVLLSQAR